MSDDDWYEKLKAEEAERDAVQFAAAKAEAKRAGREPFDANKLAQYWSFPGPKLSAESNDNYMKDLEFQYYVFCKNCRTMKEFADLLWAAELGGS